MNAMLSIEHVDCSQLIRKAAAPNRAKKRSELKDHPIKSVVVCEIHKPNAVFCHTIKR